MPIRDPILSAIENALDQPLDGNDFEAAMCSMLREQGIYPRLVPLRGGDDAGTDGAIGDPDDSKPPTPIVCTTQQDVKRNLSDNLKSHSRKIGSQKGVVFATSRSVSPAAQRQLTEAAKELGFILLNIYERAVVAELLYRSPRWCRDLLGLTTRRPALSAFPQDRRPFFDQELRGRDDELKWLNDRTNDVLVAGQPGIGKTFLLRRFSREMDGLFAVTDELDAIDAAIRESQPNFIVVSDAHARLEFLQGLRQLRNDTCGTWKIVADCWPGAQVDVRSTLSLATADVLELRPLPRDVIVEIIRDAGLAGPTDLVRELVDQSRGRAGLAVTLAFLCLQGDTRQVGIGRVLAEQVETTFKTLVGNEAINALTLLSLGGSAGLALSDVAHEIGQAVVRVQQVVVHLAAGGVVEELTAYGGNRRIVVQPETLRDALVSDRFFGKYSLPLPDHLLGAAKPVAVTEVFLGAAHRGGAVPDEVLWGRLTEHGSLSLFKSYAALGERQAQRVLTERPELLADVAPIGLRVAPAAFLPKLFDASVGDKRDAGSALSHPLRQVEDWVHSGRPGIDALSRRRSLIDAVEIWLRSGGDANIAIEAASLALVPVFRTSNSDPGSGRTFRVTHGVISAEELSGLGELWERVLGLIPAKVMTNWQPLLNAICGVASPQILGGNPGAAFYAASRDLSGKSVATLARVAADRPGMTLELRDIANRLNIELEVDVDVDFAIIYPADDFRDHDAWCANWVFVSLPGHLRRLRNCSPSIEAKRKRWDAEGRCCLSWAIQLPKAFPIRGHGLKHLRTLWEPMTSSLPFFVDCTRKITTIVWTRAAHAGGIVTFGQRLLVPS
jgi:hypothetical protein